MKRTKFSEHQIIAMLKQQEVGSKVSDIFREHGISDATIFNWKAKNSSMSAFDLKRLNELEEENSGLKKIYADISQIHEAYKDTVEKML